MMTENDLEPLVPVASSASTNCFPCSRTISIPSISYRPGEMVASTKDNFRHRHNKNTPLKSVMTASRTEECLRDNDDKVAIDFANSTARVLSDPLEIKECFKQRERDAKKMMTRSQSPEKSGDPLIMSCYFAQPWFHSSLSREEAETFFHKHGVIDGTYLIRTSEHLPGCLVLCLAHNNSVLHFPVCYMKNNCWTLDGGRTKFKDLFQLIDFYQVNASPGLPTTLTNYITVAVNIPRYANPCIPPYSV